MTVKDLIQKLEKVDPEMQVYCTSNAGEHDYCMVSTAMPMGLIIEGKEVDYDDDGMGSEETLVFVIDEE